MKNFIGLASSKGRRSILSLPNLFLSHLRTHRSIPLHLHLSPTHRHVKMPSIEHPTIKGKNLTTSQTSANPWRGMTIMAQ